MSTALQEITNTAASTPMMQQYFAVKSQYKDCLLFYRMGDFYELFFEDALIAAPVLDVALTKRGKHKDQDIPMCGVPFHSADSYLQKLIRHGFKVAICEQLETPEEAKKRGYKAVVRREVVRIVTPGTLTEEALLDARESNYLVALTRVEGKLALAWIDISTSEFAVSPTSNEILGADIARLSPKEILLPDRFLEDSELMQALREWRHCLSPHVMNFFDAVRAEEKLKTYYEVSTLQGFGDFAKAEIAALGALIEYVELTQKRHMPVLLPPARKAKQVTMVIDAATRRNLELTSTLKGERKGSVLGVMDKTLTSGGARLLYNYLSAPLTEPYAINARLDQVQFFVENQGIRERIRTVLATIPDMERAVARVCLLRGGPRDLAALRQGLIGALQLAEVLEFSKDTSHLKSALAGPLAQLGGHDSLLLELQQALADEVGFLARDGGFVRSGYHPTLDHLRHLKEHSHEMIAALREQYREETGVNSLKIQHNNVIGYYLEVTSQHVSKMQDDKFIHRQSMAGAVRYTTQELKSIESSLIDAKDKMLALELEVFTDLVAKATNSAEALMLTALAIAEIDVMSALAELAVEHQYVRPFVDDSLAFTIEGGRHLVVESFLQGEHFIPNNCDLQETERLWLLTGPNMAGKSTFLRQNALIAILAQMGSFVPATHAHIGVVDRLFSRVGAADNLARGESTFMVEMMETATILHQATCRSLVILDEIGRGTSTFDGLSIAWATLEYIHNQLKTRALFATHYHELTQLKDQLHHLRCYSMKVREWQGKVIFLHEIVPGAADRSYGIHVAKLAGLPRMVTARAEEVLAFLEQSKGKRPKQLQELPLFSYAAAASLEVQEAKAPVSEVETALRTLAIDDLSPREALDWLYKLKAMLKAEF